MEPVLVGIKLHDVFQKIADCLVKNSAWSLGWCHIMTTGFKSTPKNGINIHSNSLTWNVKTMLFQNNISYSREAFSGSIGCMLNWKGGYFSKESSRVWSLQVFHFLGRWIHPRKWKAMEPKHGAGWFGRWFFLWFFGCVCFFFFFRFQQLIWNCMSCRGKWCNK